MASRGAATATNYQILPGDRVFIASDKVTSFYAYISKIFAPVEKTLGVGSLGASTVRGFQLLGYRQYAGF